MVAVTPRAQDYKKASQLLLDQIRSQNEMSASRKFL